MDCQSGQMTVEQAQYVNQQNKQQHGQYGGNTYQNMYQNQNQNHNQGQGWRGNQSNQKNQNYGWRNNQNSMPPFQASKPPPENKVDLEEALAHMMTSHTTFMNETKASFQNRAQQLQNQSTQLQNQGAQLRNLEVKIGQMATLLIERQHGALPSNSEVNLRQEGNEHVKTVTLRSGK